MKTITNEDAPAGKARGVDRNAQRLAAQHDTDSNTLFLELAPALFCELAAASADRRLLFADVRVYAAMLSGRHVRRADGSLTCRMSHSRIAEASGVHAQSIRRSVRNLVNTGRLEVHVSKGGRYTPNTYALLSLSPGAGAAVGDDNHSAHAVVGRTRAPGLARANPDTHAVVEGSNPGTHAPRYLKQHQQASCRAYSTLLHAHRSAAAGAFQEPASKEWEGPDSVGCWPAAGAFNGGTA